MAAETYVKVSGTHREVFEVYIKTGGSWVPVKEIHAKVSGVWQLVWQLFALNLDALTDLFGEASTSVGGANVTAYAGVRLQPDGILEKRLGYNDISQIDDAWGRPITAGIGDTHHVRLDVNSGDPPDIGTPGVWMDVSTMREFTVKNTDNSSTSRGGNWTLRLSNDGGATTKVSKSFDVTAYVLAL